MRFRFNTLFRDILPLWHLVCHDNIQVQYIFEGHFISVTLGVSWWDSSSIHYSGTFHLYDTWCDMSWGSGSIHYWGIFHLCDTWCIMMRFRLNTLFRDISPLWQLVCHDEIQAQYIIQGHSTSLILGVTCYEVQAQYIIQGHFSSLTLGVSWWDSGSIHYSGAFNFSDTWCDMSWGSGLIHYSGTFHLYVTRCVMMRFRLNTLFRDISPLWYSVCHDDIQTGSIYFSGTFHLSDTWCVMIRFRLNTLFKDISPLCHLVCHDEIQAQYIIQGHFTSVTLGVSW